MNQTVNKPISKDVRVIIVEDYKLTRMGLKSSLNEFEIIKSLLAIVFWKSSPSKVPSAYTNAAARWNEPSLN